MVSINSCLISVMKKFKNGVPIENGGTGVTTASSALTKLGVVDKIYPVGSVYISYKSTSPSSLFGGSWTELKGVFPYFNSGTGTGGSNTHTLTVAEMPSHRHSFTVRATSGTTQAWRVDYQNVQGQTVNTNNTGGGGSHNNMPAYQTFYAWRRTA